MKKLYLYTLTLFFLFCSASCRKENNTGEVKGKENPFIGKWKLVVFDGTPSSGNTTWQFLDTSLVITTNDSITFQGSYAFKSDVNPKTIEVKIKNAIPNSYLAIYKFVALDSLYMKFMDGASKQATNFDPEHSYDLEVFRKQ